MNCCFTRATNEQSLPALIERWLERGAGNDSETNTAAAAAEGKHLCDCALTAEDHEGGREGGRSCYLRWVAFFHRMVRECAEEFPRHYVIIKMGGKAKESACQNT